MFGLDDSKGFLELAGYAREHYNGRTSRPANAVKRVRCASMNSSV